MYSLQNEIRSLGIKLILSDFGFHAHVTYARLISSIRLLDELHT